MVHGILALRLYALYGSKVLGCFLSTLLSLAVTAEIYALISYRLDAIDVDLGQTIGSVCFVVATPMGSFLW